LATDQDSSIRLRIAFVVACFAIPFSLSALR
jgi:hypothetical protein